jgi:hypothetical protein
VAKLRTIKTLRALDATDSEDKTSAFQHRGTVFRNASSGPIRTYNGEDVSVSASEVRMNHRPNSQFMRHIYHATEIHADQTVATDSAEIERRSGEERRVDSAALVADLSDDDDAPAAAAVRGNRDRRSREVRVGVDADARDLEVGFVIVCGAATKERSVTVHKLTLAGGPTRARRKCLRKVQSQARR